MITAFGKTYADTLAATARIAVLHSLNETWGESDDRVTEINALREGIAIWEAAQAEGMTEEPAEVWTVAKNEYEVPCEHPLCEQLHQRFMVEEKCSGLIQTANVSVWREWTERYHNRTVSEWVILHNGERDDLAGRFDAFDTKRDALAALTRAGLL
ncbi:hypothetical protein [Terracoccus sp. 273MFTsu3.1]|uniref:hypothetical protein n=1 Tax=Terracoccus sp. 273MFTsu3.1 TaxID=1172188 RepID=UPI00036EC108|nr:hypothetical protein [Terracoccus sp. 273MFTsu3.1]